MPDQPTFDDLAKFAEVLNNKSDGFYGLALRGQPGWGEYQKAAPFAKATLKAMETADPTNPCIKKVPYTGITFVGIPEFQSLGSVVGQNISGLVAGKASLEETLKSNQNQAGRTMKQGGYIK